MASEMTQREAVALMGSTPAMLKSLLAAFPAGWLDQRPAAEEWSAREILAHLLNVEALLSARVESMIAAEGSPITRHAAAPSEGLDAFALLARWGRARARSLRRLRELTPDDLQHGAELPRWGLITVEQQVCEWAYHDVEHLRQLLANLEASLYPSIGGFQGLYAPPYPAATRALDGRSS